MASLQAIKRRIRSVKGTHQITKAMQMVAASKLRRAQGAAVGPQDYVAAARELLARLGNQPMVRRHPLYRQRPVKQALTILIAGDRGMAGAYNSNIMRELGRHIVETGVPMQAITIGRRASVHIARASDVEEIEAFDIDKLDADTGIAQPVLETVIQKFLAGEVDAVHIIHTHFASTVKQEVVRRQLLPVLPPEEAEVVAGDTEPEPQDLIEYATRRVLEADLLQAILEARASEQAARMLAMMNATDNAKELITDLTLAFNNARQANITQELAEISGGAEAVTD